MVGPSMAVRREASTFPAEGARSQEQGGPGGSVLRSRLLPSPGHNLFFALPLQVGVSEAGLQHEILRRVQKLLDATRIEPGTDAGAAAQQGSSLT